MEYIGKVVKTIYECRLEAAKALIAGWKLYHLAE
jgi:hypothetical protein